MKRIIPFILSLVLCLSAAAPAFAAEGGELPGDLNGDRVVNGKDAVCAERCLETPDSLPSVLSADLNHDGEVNGDDVLFLKSAFAETVKNSGATEAAAAGKYSVTAGESGSAYLSFTPEKSGKYTFTPVADGDTKPWSALYDSDGNLISSVNCDGTEAEDHESGLTAALERGTKYYLEVGADDGDGRNFEIDISAAKSGFAFPLFSKGGWQIVLALVVISLGDVVATAVSRRRKPADAGIIAENDNNDEG